MGDGVGHGRIRESDTPIIPYALSLPVPYPSPLSRKRTRDYWQAGGQSLVVPSLAYDCGTVPGTTVWTLPHTYFPTVEDDSKRECRAHPKRSTAPKVNRIPFIIF